MGAGSKKGSGEPQSLRGQPKADVLPLETVQHSVVHSHCLKCSFSMAGHHPVWL